MTSFGLKMAALISMLCDHCGYIFLDKQSLLNVIGRVAFPIFAFQISEGYKHTKDLKLYFYRLFVFAIISQIPFMLFLRVIGTTTFTLNIFFTLLLGLLAIMVYDKQKNKPLSLFLVLLIIILAQIAHCDYGWFGIAIIFLFYLFKDKKLAMNLSIIATIITKYIILYILSPSILHIYSAIGTCLSLIFINIYNNKKGRNIKYFLYIFYPLHLMILFIIKLVLI